MFTASEVQEARAICAAAYEAFKEGELDAMMGFYDSDVVLTAPSMSGKGGSTSRICGKDKLLVNVGAWFRLFTMDQMDVDRLIADGNVDGEGIVVVALVREGATCSRTGRRWKAHRMAHVMLVSDGQIKRFDEYCDPTEVVGACKHDCRCKNGRCEQGHCSKPL